MNAKIEKLRAERSKNDSKIEALNQRNKEIDEAITQIENGEIVVDVPSNRVRREKLEFSEGYLLSETAVMVKSAHSAAQTYLSMEELAEYLKAFRKSKAPFSVNAESEATDYDEN